MDPKTQLFHSPRRFVVAWEWRTERYLFQVEAFVSHS